MDSYFGRISSWIACRSCIVAAKLVSFDKLYPQSCLMQAIPCYRHQAVRLWAQTWMARLLVSAVQHWPPDVDCWEHGLGQHGPPCLPSGLESRWLPWPHQWTSWHRHMWRIHVSQTHADVLHNSCSRFVVLTSVHFLSGWIIMLSTK